MNRTGKQELDTGGPEFDNRRGGAQALLLRKVRRKILLTNGRTDRKTDRPKSV